MTAADLVALGPIIIVGVAAVVALMLCAFARHHALVAGVSIAGLAGGLALLPAAAKVSRRVTALIVVDAYTIEYSALVLGIALVTAVLSADYLGRRLGGRREEFYVMLLLAALGGLVLPASDHFATFFLGLEILSISLYTMIAYLRNDRGALEAAVKYLVLAGASSAFLLFGMALLYLETGTMTLSALAAALADVSGVVAPAGAALVVVGVGFKLAVVPFHMWTPDVYDGAPAPVTGFLATASKAAVFAVVLRMFFGFPPDLWHHVMPLFIIVAAASMIVGNLLALLQIYVKRILAYSSIAHMGYLFVAFLAGGAHGAAAATFYLFAYSVTTLAAFGTIGALSRVGGEPETLDDYRGLFWRRPGLATVLAVALFSLAGIPLTAGFLGKFYVISAGIEGGLWLILGVLIINSAIGLYYYLRVVVAMFSRVEAGEAAGARNTAGETARTGAGDTAGAEAPSSAVRWPAGAALVVLVVLLVWLGVYPSPLIDWIRLATFAVLP